MKDDLAKKFWQEYLNTLPISERPTNPTITVSVAGNNEITDELISLYISGKKTAGSSLKADYIACNDPLPEVGNYWILLNSKNIPQCIVCTTAVETLKFKDADERIARAEGEGDLSLGYWRKVHIDFFTPFLEKWKVDDLDNALLVVEHSKLVFNPVLISN